MPSQNGRQFADDIFKRIFWSESVRISIKKLLKFFPKGPINNISALDYRRTYASLGLDELTHSYYNAQQRSWGVQTLANVTDIIASVQHRGTVAGNSCRRMGILTCPNGNCTGACFSWCGPRDCALKLDGIWSLLSRHPLDILPTARWIKNLIILSILCMIRMYTTYQGFNILTYKIHWKGN